MAIQMKKGGRINLSKEAPTLVRVGVGLGWDTNQFAGNAIDLDTSAFMINASGKIPEDEYFIFYNNLKSPDGSLEHTGDNRTGLGDGDDETLFVHLDKINPEITEILFVTTIHEADIRKQNFGQVKNAYIRIYNRDNNAEIAKYDLDEDFSYETAVEFGRLYFKDREWRFQATGQGFNNGLEGFVDKYA